MNPYDCMTVQSFVVVSSGFFWCVFLFLFFGSCRSNHHPWLTRLSRGGGYCTSVTCNFTLGLTCVRWKGSTLGWTPCQHNMHPLLCLQVLFFGDWLTLHHSENDTEFFTRNANKLYTVNVPLVTCCNPAMFGSFWYVDLLFNTVLGQNSLLHTERTLPAECLKALSGEEIPMGGNLSQRHVYRQQVCQGCPAGCDWRWKTMFSSLVTVQGTAKKGIIWNEHSQTFGEQCKATWSLRDLILHSPKNIFTKRPM